MLSVFHVTMLNFATQYNKNQVNNACKVISSSLVNVANWDSIPVFVKATGGLSKPGWSTVRNSIGFVLFEVSNKKNYI